MGCLSIYTHTDTVRLLIPQHHTPNTQVRYYRYLRFCPGGRLIYGLLYQPPHEAVRIFKVRCRVWSLALGDEVD